MFRGIFTPLSKELVARESEPLTADDARKERERRRDFVEEVRERRARGVDPRPEAENRVELNDLGQKFMMWSIIHSAVAAMRAGNSPISMP